MRFLSIACVVAALGCGSSSSLGDPDTGLIDAALPVPDAPLPDAPLPDAAVPADAFIPTGGHTQYVVNTIDIPTSASEAQLCGLNVDGDALNRVDNALGQIIAALAGAGGGDPQAVMDLALANGAVLHLFDVQADSLVADPTVSLRAFFGEDTDGNPTDNFSGSEPFDIDAASPPDALVTGPIDAGQLGLGPGQLSVRIVPFAGGPPVDLPLIGVRILGNISSTNITNGVLGGAITEENVDTIVIPALAANVQAVIAADCGGTYPNCCASGSSGATMVNLFDTDMDCQVSVDEIRNSNLIQSLITPDVDLFDASGAFNPLQDGVRDSLSLGVCFTAVGAVFTLP